MTSTRNLQLTGNGRPVLAGVVAALLFGAIGSTECHAQQRRSAPWGEGAGQIAAEAVRRACQAYVGMTCPHSPHGGPGSHADHNTFSGGQFGVGVQHNSGNGPVNNQYYRQDSGGGPVFNTHVGDNRGNIINGHGTHGGTGVAIAPRR